MTREEMLGAVNALRDNAAMIFAINQMQQIHAGDHKTPTHTADIAHGGEIKSFYMKKTLVSERDGFETKAIWGKEQVVQRNKTVSGFIPINAADEAQIVKMALRLKEFMVVSDDDKDRHAFLYVSEIPAPYAGFDFQMGAALPVQVNFNVIIIKKFGKSFRLSSVYPTGSGRLDRKPGPRHVIT